MEKAYKIIALSVSVCGARISTFEPYDLFSRAVYELYATGGQPKAECLTLIVLMWRIG